MSSDNHSDTATVVAYSAMGNSDAGDAVYDAVAEYSVADENAAAEGFYGSREFHNVTLKDVHEFIAREENKNTVRKH